MRRRSYKLRTRCAVAAWPKQSRQQTFTFAAGFLVNSRGPRVCAAPRRRAVWCVGAAERSPYTRYTLIDALERHERLICRISANGSDIDRADSFSLSFIVAGQIPFLYAEEEISA